MARRGTRVRAVDTRRYRARSGSEMISRSYPRVGASVRHYRGVGNRDADLPAGIHVE